MRFTSAYACQPICSPSRAGLLTGINPARLHLTTFLNGRPNGTSQRVLHPEIMLNVPLSVTALPRYFKAAGYVTGFIGKWHIGREFGPKEHGFDFVYHSVEGRNSEPSVTEGGKAEYELTAKTIEFIEENQERPFVAYLGHFTPHIPYAAKEHLVAKNRGAFEPVYAAVIETLDDTVGLIMDKLDDLNLSEKTILVFTSDNGGLHVPEGPHDRITHNTPFRAGKGYVYEGGQRVPLVVRWPGHIPQGEVTDAVVSNVDWIPTLLELSGAMAPEGLDGRSFAPLLLGGSHVARKMFWHFPHYTNQGGRPSGAVRDGNWLLVELYDEQRTELYDLSVDIGEKTDIAKLNPKRVAAMRKELNQWRADNEVQYNSPNPECREEDFRKLYVDIDPSRFDPAAADDGEWAEMLQWRTGMRQIYQAAPDAGP
jgi:arylsulfatase A